MASQTDIFRDDPRREAQAYREAAESALLNPFEDPGRRQARHDHYTAEAARLEAAAWPVTGQQEGGRA